jgi:hypothetical protein
LHPSNVDMEKFYAECIPRTSLPSDFGGTCESVEVLHKRHCEEFKRLRPFFLAEERQAALELDTCDKINLGNELMRESERNFKNISID